MTTQEIILLAGIFGGAWAVLCAMYLKFGPGRIVYSVYDDAKRWGRREVYGEKAALLSGIAMAAVCLIGALVGGSGVLAARNCRMEADGMGLTSRWTYEGTCQVLFKDRWLRFDKYRYNLALEE